MAEANRTTARALLGRAVLACLGMAAVVAVTFRLRPPGARKAADRGGLNDSPRAKGSFSTARALVSTAPSAARRPASAPLGGSVAPTTTDACTAPVAPTAERAGGSRPVSAFPPASVSSGEDVDETTAALAQAAPHTVPVLDIAVPDFIPRAFEEGSAVRPFTTFEVPIFAPAIAFPPPVAVRPLSKRTSTRALPARRVLAAGVGIVVLAAFVRLFHHTTNNDIFIDEITYAHIARNLATGHGVTLFGQGFYLHPPAYIYLAAGFLKLFGEQKDLLATVLQLRVLNSALGALEVLMLMLLVSRTVGRQWGLLIGLLAALDPFMLLWDGRVLLESAAMAGALIGWSLLTLLYRTDRAGLIEGGVDPALPRGRSYGIAALAGLFFGLSLLSKETYAFVGVVPLVVLAVLRRPLPRRLSLTAIGVCIACFLAYVATLVINSDIAGWWDQQTAGLRRAAGTEQISGFNQKGTASFTSRLISNVGIYLGSYVIIALIAVALVMQLRRLWIGWRQGEATAPGELLLFAYAAGGAFYVGYAVLFGAFEEQIFYIYEVAGLPLLALWTKRTWSSHGRLSLRVRRRVLTSILAAVFVFGLAVDVYVRSTRDTNLVDLHNYVATHLPRHAVVDPTDGVSEYLLDTRIIVLLTDVPQLRKSNVRYVVINSTLNTQGYVHLSEGFLPWLERAGRVIFREHDRDGGTILLYKLRLPAYELNAAGDPIPRADRTTY